jgi:hypothetical protein
MAEVWEQAQQEYPRLRSQNVVYKRTPRKGMEKLEAWPPGETGTRDRPRPKEFPSDRYGVEVYSSAVRPIDVLGDVVSHFMANNDPTIKDIYNRFSSSLTSQQMDRLVSQYKWSQAHERERRNFSDWLTSSGLPAYFRGMPFQQWPQDQTRGWYTPQQMQMFDEMMKYLRTE